MAELHPLGRQHPPQVLTSSRKEQHSSAPIYRSFSGSTMPRSTCPNERRAGRTVRSVRSTAVAPPAVRRGPLSLRVPVGGLSVAALSTSAAKLRNACRRQRPHGAAARSKLRQRFHFALRTRRQQTGLHRHAAAQRPSEEPANFRLAIGLARGRGVRHPLFDFGPL